MDTTRLLLELSHDTEEVWAEVERWAARHGVEPLVQACKTEQNRINIKATNEDWRAQVVATLRNVEVAGEIYCWGGTSYWRYSPGINSVVHLVTNGTIGSRVDALCGQMCKREGRPSTRPCLKCIDTMQRSGGGAGLNLAEHAQALRDLRDGRLRRRIQEGQ